MDVLPFKSPSAGTDFGTVGALLLSDLAKHQWRSTQSTDPDKALAYDMLLASSYKPTALGSNSSSKAVSQADTATVAEMLPRGLHFMVILKMTTFYSSLVI